MNKPFFSIVIPTYNRATLLKRCLDSIESQTYTKWEAIVVDNFSEDNTEEIVMSYKDDRIKFVKNHNYGIIAVSRNKAIDLALGDWICFLDSDDQWIPNKLECIIPHLDSCDLIYHGLIKDMKKERCFQRLTTYFYPIKEVSVPYVLKRGDPISPSCSAVSIRALGNIRFDESRELRAIEDYDFFLQLIAKGIRIKHLKKALTIYDMSTGCSHGRDGLDRSRYLYNKYFSYFSDNDKRDVLMYYMWEKGCYFYSNKYYKEALSCFCVSSFSKVLLVKKNSIYAIIKSLVLIILERIQLKK